MERRLNARFFAALLLVALAGCRGAVTARGMKALGPWSDREIALEPATPGEPEQVAWARVGAREGMEKAGLAFTGEPSPGALVVRVRQVGEREGMDTLLSSPGKFAAAAAAGVAGEAAKIAGGAKTGVVRDAGAIVGTGLALGRGVADVREGARVRIALELFAPERGAPVGGVVWEGFQNLDRNGAAERAGREGGAALADEIASQRDRWVDRRVASERLFLTTTPLLLEQGEAVLSLDQALLLHAGYGVTRWLQLDVTLGGVYVPTAGGIAFSRWDGVTIMGTLAAGLKVRVADETPLWPGIAGSYERVGLWSGAIGSGRIALLGHVVDRSDPDASSHFGLNVFTLALSKHLREWLQVGGGATLVDAHPLFGSGTPVTDLDGGGAAERLPAQVLPFVNVEARAGEHFRFIGEYLAVPGADSLSVGVRTLLFGSRRFGELRTAGYKVKLDAAAIFTSRDAAVVVLPWFGVAVYR